MTSYILRQLGNVLATLLVASLIVFVVCELTPGTVARKILGPYATPEQVDVLTQSLGLDRPAPVRYLEFLGDVVRFDFGQSLIYNQPVVEIMGDRILNTLMLAAICFCVIVPVSVCLGLLSGLNERKPLDRVILTLSSAIASIPEFAMGVFLIGIFTIGMGLLPGVTTLQGRDEWPLWSQLVLPVSVVSLYVIGYLVPMMREATIYVAGQHYVRTAVLKGMGPVRVALRHVLRNAIIRPFPVILLQLNYLIAGLVVVETLFSFPGFGRLMLEAAMNKDIAVIEAGTLFTVLIAITTQFLGDIARLLLNPPARSAARTGRTS